MKKIYRPFLTLGITAYLAVGILIFVPASQSLAASEQKSVDIIFSEIEKRIIGDFFDQQAGKSKSKGKGKKGKSGKGLPPGLAKKETLPPGLAQQLKKNGTLPPGLAKRDLPSDLSARLPHRSSIFDRVIVGDDVLLMKRGANLIYDIIKDAVKN